MSLNNTLRNRLNVDDIEAIAVEDGGKRYALYHTTVSQPHLRCKLPVYEWFVQHNEVCLYSGWKCVHKMDQEQFVAWVLERYVGKVVCCNYWEKGK